MLHIIIERDVGLFSLVQQVIGHVRLAIHEGRTPIAYFGKGCCYWVDGGYEGKLNVWEYYFEPVVESHAVDTIPQHVKDYAKSHPILHIQPGHYIGDEAFVTKHFGDHKVFEGKSLKIPYLWNDPPSETRKTASEIIKKYVRPRKYILEQVTAYMDEHMANEYVVGVHIRGTDVNDRIEHNIHRRGSYDLSAYVRKLENLLHENPQAKIYVATDTNDALSHLKSVFPGKILHHSSIFHTDENGSGKGPSGWIMPGYLTENAAKAAKNGEEAIIDYLLLSECNYLIHNGSALARTALLKNPDLPQHNIHSLSKYLRKILLLYNFEFYYVFKILAIRFYRQIRDFILRRNQKG